MKCFLCERNDKRLMYMKLPLETYFQGVWIEIIGNAKPDEYICVPCVGYQIDDIKGEAI